MSINSAAAAPSSLARGSQAGATAGLVLLVAECCGSVALGGLPFAPARLAASAVLGPGALSPFFPLPGPLVLGTCVFLLLGGLFGALLALLIRPGERRRRPTLIIAVSAVYGGLIWILGGLVVGPLLFPQITVLDLIWQGFVAHVVFFGLVLGVLLTRASPR
jgi:hypothetical protein